MKPILPKIATASFLVLITKVDNHQNLEEYRPICLVESLQNFSQVTDVKGEEGDGETAIQISINFLFKWHMLDGVF